MADIRVQVCYPSAPQPLLRELTLGEGSLLRDARQPWSDWFKSIGLDLPEPERGPVYNEPSLVLQAAIAGQGVALARTALASRDLADGRLLRPMRHEIPADFAYWIVCPHAGARRPNVRRCIAWLLEQAAG